MELLNCGQQINTELGFGSSLLLRDQASPNSFDMYRAPDLSTTTIIEPFVAMQPVSAIPVDPLRQAIFDGYYISIRSNRPTINSSLGCKMICRRGD